MAEPEEDDDPVLSLMMEFFDSLSPEGQAYVREFGIDDDEFEAWLRGMTPAQLKAEKQKELKAKARKVLAGLTALAPPTKKVMRRL